jgi:hypothetical protein
MATMAMPCGDGFTIEACGIINEVLNRLATSGQCQNAGAWALNLWISGGISGYDGPGHIDPSGMQISSEGDAFLWALEIMHEAAHNLWGVTQENDQDAEDYGEACANSVGYYM